MLVPVGKRLPFLFFVIVPKSVVAAIFNGFTATGYKDKLKGQFGFINKLKMYIYIIFI